MNREQRRQEQRRATKARGSGFLEPLGKPVMWHHTGKVENEKKMVRECVESRTRLSSGFLERWMEVKEFPPAEGSRDAVVFHEAVRWLTGECYDKRILVAFCARDWATIHMRCRHRECEEVGHDCSETTLVANQDSNLEFLRGHGSQECHVWDWAEAFSVPAMFELMRALRAESGDRST